MSDWIWIDSPDTPLPAFPTAEQDGRRADRPPGLLHVWRGYEWNGLTPPIGTLSYCGRRKSTTRATMSCEDSPNDCVVCLDLAPEWEWGAI